MNDVIARHMAFGLVGIVVLLAVVLLVARKWLRDQPHPDVVVEPVCSCEYVDVGIGSMLANPDPECAVHSLEMLAAMTYGRHSMERDLQIEAVRTHWAHEGCPCGCVDTQGGQA